MEQALQVPAIVAATFDTAALSSVAGFGGGVLLLAVFVTLPAAVAGAVLFATASLPALTRVVDVFLLAMVAGRRWKPHAGRLDDTAFTTVGAASGFDSALVGSVGAMVAPFFLAL